MSDNEARAREDQRKRANTLLLKVFEGDLSAFSAADVAHAVSALDAAEDRGRAAGLREAKDDAPTLRAIADAINAACEARGKLAAEPTEPMSMTCARAAWDVVAGDLEQARHVVGVAEWNEQHAVKEVARLSAERDALRADNDQAWSEVRAVETTLLTRRDEIAALRAELTTAQARIAEYEQAFLSIQKVLTGLAVANYERKSGLERSDK